MLSPPMDRYILNNPLKELSNSDLKLFIKKNSFLGYHASGTCAMGHKGVLSSNLKVKNLNITTQVGWKDDKNKNLFN